jgi:hypothetical protein
VQKEKLADQKVHQCSRAHGYAWEALMGGYLTDMAAARN